MKRSVVLFILMSTSLLFACNQKAQKAEPMASKAKTKVFTARSGQKVTLDVSDQACRQFGFKCGDVILDPICRESTVVGTGPEGEGDPKEILLWVAMPQDGGRVSNYSDGSQEGVKRPVDLRQFGFRLRSDAKYATPLPTVIEDLGLKLDTTDTACQKFGFKRGDVVALPATARITEAAILGVGKVPSPRYPTDVVLWMVDRCGSLGFYWQPEWGQGPVDLRTKGFKKIAVVQ